MRSLEPSDKAPEASMVTAPAATTSTRGPADRENAPEPKARVRLLTGQRKLELAQWTLPKVRFLEPPGKTLEASHP